MKLQVNHQFVQVPFKRTEKLSFKPILLHYIQSVYHQNPLLFEQDISSVDTARDELITLELHESSLSSLLRYLQILKLIQDKFPIAEDKINLMFNWYNVFGNEESPISSSLNMDFESCCVEFNIAALFSQMALLENENSETGLKKMCLYFQNAAGIFGSLFLKSKTKRSMSHSPDLRSRNLEFLVKLMLSQAQECFYLKAVGDSMKPTTLIKLAQSTAQFYEKSCNLFDGSSVDIIKPLKSFIQAKRLYYLALAQYTTSQECFKRGTYGELVGRLSYAFGLIKEALDVLNQDSEFNRILCDVQKLHGTIQKDLVRAAKDNDFVYMQPVPKAETLVLSSTANMVQPNLPAQLQELTTAVDLFEKLVPFEIYEETQPCTSQITLTVDELPNETNESTEWMLRKLHELRLPAAAEKLPLNLPQSNFHLFQTIRYQDNKKEAKSKEDCI